MDLDKCLTKEWHMNQVIQIISDYMSITTTKKKILKKFKILKIRKK